MYFLLSNFFFMKQPWAVHDDSAAMAVFRFSG